MPRRLIAPNPSWKVRIAQVLFVAVAYCLAGRAALMLAIPPGYATAIWPAAGVAVAGVLLFGKRVAPGILLGSILVNIWTAMDRRDLWTGMGPAVVLSGCIGVGAMLEALFAAWLVRRFVGFPDPLVREWQIVKFMMLSGPVAALMGATIGPLTLVYFERVPPANLLFNSFTWWVGDSMGVLLFLPLVLMFVGEPAHVWRPRRFSVGIPLMGAFAVAVVVFVAASRWEHHQAMAECEKKAEMMARMFDSTMQRSITVLRSLGGLFASSDVVTRYEFQTFASSTLNSYSGVEVVAWSKRVREGDREKFEAKIRAEGFPKFQILHPNERDQLVPAKTSDEYMPVLFLEPMRPEAVGLDHYSRIPRADIERACETGQPMMTSPLRLLGSRRSMGVLVFLPVYGKGLKNATPEQRRANFTGLLTAVVRLQTLARTALQQVDYEGLEVQIEDATPGAADRVLYTEFARPYTDQDGVQWSVPMHIVGRSWLLRAFRSNQYLYSHRSFQAWAVLAGGLVVSSLLGSFLLALTGRAARVESLVQARTQQLSESNDSLVRVLEELKGSKESADAATRAKTEFLANMSHEIRTPMTSILGYTGLLAENGIDEKNRNEYLQIIHRNGEHLLEIIDDILDISKIEAGEMRIQRVTFSPATLVQEVQKVMEPRAGDEHIRFTTHVQGGVPDQVISDPTRLRQILLNLLSNAIKFTPQGEVSLTLTARAQNDKCLLQFDVKDTGIGLSPELKQKVFLPFVQADTSTTRRRGGTGLGLAICNRLVRLLGGQLTMTSELGVGSTFSVMVPVEAEPSTANACAPPAVEKVPALSGRALLAEDSPDSRRLITHYLKAAGLEVSTASDGRVAVEMVLDAHARGQDFNLLLIDMQMPELDGYDATRQIRAAGLTDLPIIALTAHAMDGDREKCLAAGCDDYATKPVNRAGLIQMLARHLALTPSPSGRGQG